jgi:circadian clock protein KaiC
MTGIKGFDEVTAGGLPKGRPTLVCGSAGCCKTLFAMEFLVRGAIDYNEPGVFMSFEESKDQIIRNMRFIGIDLEPWENKGLLRFRTTRVGNIGLEMHLLTIHQLVDEFKPQVSVVDPISNLISLATLDETKNMLRRLIDYLKMNCVTAFFTDLTHGSGALEGTEVGLSLLMDTWVLLRDIENQGERNRGLCILKSRGMAHSNQMREFLLTDEGIDLIDVYIGPGGVLTGSARCTREAEEAGETLASMRGKIRSSLKICRLKVDVRYIGFRCQGSGVRVQVSGFRCQGSGVRFRVSGPLPTELNPDT